jgi:hypothetical protein
MAANIKVLQTIILAVLALIMTGFLAIQTDLPEDWFPMTGDEAYYLTPEEAVEMNIIDELSVAEAPH